MKETQSESSKIREIQSRSFRFRRLFWSLSQRRLAETIGPYRRELEYLIAKCENKEEGSTTLWATAALDLLNKVQEALNKGEAELGWQYLNSAQLMAISGLDNGELKIKAKAILREADKKLTSWRKETVVDLLVEKDKTTVKDKLTVSAVQYANRILQEQFTNTYNKLRTLKWQFGWLALAAFLAAVLSLYLVPSMFQLTDPNLIHLVALFGMMGASLSGILSIAGRAEAGIPEQILTSWITLTRPLIGAIAALAVFVSLMSGLLHLGEVTPSLVLAVSFAAGFSERLVMSVVENIK